MEKFLKIAVILGAVDRASSVIENAVRKGNRALGDMGKSARISEALVTAGQRATVAGAAITGAMGLAVAAAEESATANARLDQVFRSMGETTGEAARKASEFASTLSMQIAVEDELILLTQAKLATFKQVSSETARMNGVFDRATKAAFDLAAAGFGEASQNAVQLGKALQDPIKGIASLARSGVTFTESEKEKIKALTESGRILEAQNVILAAVEQQVGGVAAATANDSAKMAVAFGEVQESIGKALLPALASLARWLQEVVPKIQAFIENNQWLVKGIAALGVALTILGPILMVASSAVTVFSAALWANPITWIVAAIIAAIAAIAYMVVKWRTLTKAFQESHPVIKVLLAPIIALFMPLIAIAFAIRKIIDNWSRIKAFFQTTWDSVRTIFNNAWTWIKDFFLNFHPLGLIYKHWDKITAFFSRVWQGVTRVFNNVLDFVVNLHVKFYEAGKNIVNAIWEGIKEMSMKPVKAIEDMAKKMREYLPFSPAKVGPLRDIHRIRLVETIAESVKPAALMTRMNSVMGQVRQTLNVNSGGGLSAAMIPAMGGGGGPVINFNPQVTINGGGPESERNFRGILTEFKDELMRMIRDEQSRTNRRSLG